MNGIHIDSKARQLADFMEITDKTLTNNVGISTKKGFSSAILDIVEKTIKKESIAFKNEQFEKFIDVFCIKNSQVSINKITDLYTNHPEKINQKEILNYIDERYQYNMFFCFCTKEFSKKGNITEITPNEALQVIFLCIVDTFKFLSQKADSITLNNTESQVCFKTTEEVGKYTTDLLRKLLNNCINTSTRNIGDIVLELIEAAVNKKELNIKDSYFESYVQEILTEEFIYLIRKQYCTFQGTFEFSSKEVEVFANILNDIVRMFYASETVMTPDGEPYLTDEQGMSIIFMFIYTIVNVMTHHAKYDELKKEKKIDDKVYKDDVDSCYKLVDKLKNKNTSLENDLITIKGKYEKLKNSLDARIEKKVEKQSKLLEQEKSSIVSENNRLKAKLEQLQEENTKLQNTLNKHEKQAINNEKIDTLNKRIKTLTEQNAQLRQAIANPTTEDFDEFEDMPDDRAININRNLLFIGGHTTTLDKLQNIYSKADYVSNETTEINQNYMNNFEGIVFLTDFLSHNLYKKIKKLADKYKIKYIHCKNNNVDLIVDDIENNF
jgi:uncharacterized protein YlxW (UPF0749 family)